MGDDRIFALVALVTILLWVGGGQLGDPRIGFWPGVAPMSCWPPASALRWSGS